MVRRYDLAQPLLSKPELTPEGFLRAPAALTRTGVFIYRNADGTTRGELRLPEEVFHPDALASFRLAPVTLLHPAVPVTAANVRDVQVGSIGDTVTQDGDKVVSNIAINDKRAVDEVLSGRAQQLSCGYDCELEMTPGEYQGQHYDAIQRGIRGNHVALVPAGRAGPSVGVRLDAQDAMQVDPAQTSGALVKTKIGGKEFDVSDEVAHAVIRADEQHAQALAGKDAELKLARSETEKATARADAAQAKADSAEAAAKKAEQARADAADPKRFHGAVEERVELLSKVQRVLGTDESKKLAKADKKDLQVAVLAKLAPDFKADGKSEDYLAARFDAELERFDSQNPGLDKLTQVSAGLGPNGKPEPKLDAKAAAEERARQHENRWKDARK